MDDDSVTVASPGKVADIGVTGWVVGEWGSEPLSRGFVDDPPPAVLAGHAEFRIHRGRPWLALQLCSRGSLAARVKHSGPLSTDEAVEPKLSIGGLFRRVKWIL